MSGILTVAFKDLRLLSRDRFSLFWTLAFPLIFALFFGSLFGGESTQSAMTVVVLDEAQTEASAAFVQRLGDSEAVDVRPVADLDAAATAVQKGKAVAYVRVGEAYRSEGFAMFGAGSQDPPVEVGVDPSRTAERGMLQGLVSQALFSGLGQSISDPAAMSLSGRGRARADRGGAGPRCAREEDADRADGCARVVWR